MPSFAQNFSQQLGFLSGQIEPNAELYFWFLCAGLIFTRIFMMLLVAPFIGSKSVPARIRIATTVAFTIFLYPVLKPTFVVDQFPGWGPVVIGLFLKESLIGFAIGFVSALIFYGIQAAGLMIDNQRGVANAQIFVPQLGSQGSIFGMFQFQAAVAIFLAIGGHRQFLSAFFQGFVDLPIFYTPDFEPGIYSFFELFILLTADVLILSVKLSAPIVIAIFLSDVVLGIANKVAPAINVFELGFTVKGVVGVLVTFISLVILYRQFADETLNMVNTVRELFQRLG